MANKKISELPSATLPILGSGSLVELVQGGINVQTDPDNIGGGVVPDADATTKGIAKLYTDVAAQNTDGAPDQNAVFDALALKATLASPTFTGTPAAPTAAAGTNTTQVATTAFVRAEIVSPRVQTVASAATVTPNLDTDDSVVITAQAVGLTIANPTGTKRDMYEFTIRIKDNGTARAISFGTEYRVMEITLPTTTVISKYMFLQCCVNSVDTKIDVVAVVNEI